MRTSHFTQWIEQTDVKSKINAVHTMCEAYIQGDYQPDYKRAAEQAMILLLDDPSPEVRQALSARICVSDMVPLFILNKLAQDQIEVAAPVLAYSPYLTDNCLVDHIASGTFQHRMIIAQRANISAGISAALIEAGEQEVVFELLKNTSAEIVGSCLERVVDKFGFEGKIRTLMLERQDLTTAMRLKLVEDLCDEFAQNVFVSRLVGVRRAGYITQKSRQHARLALVKDCFEKDIDPLAEYLLRTQQITQGFLMSVLCVGNVEFFASAIGKLTNTSSKRIGNILNDGNKNSVMALYKKSGISQDLAPIFVDATMMWRHVANENRRDHANQIMAYLVQKYSKNMAQNQVVAELLMAIENIRANQFQYGGDEYIASLIDQAA